MTITEKCRSRAVIVRDSYQICSPSQVFAIGIAYVFMWITMCILASEVLECYQRHGV